MTAWAELDDRTLLLPRCPPVSACSRRTIGRSAAMHPGARNLLAFPNGLAQPARGIDPDDLFIAKAFHDNTYLPGWKIGGEQWLTHV
jgi:hypothetical protein